MLIFDPTTGKNVYVSSKYEAAGSPRNCAYAFCQHPITDEAYRSDSKFYCSQGCVDADRSLTT